MYPFKLENNYFVQGFERYSEVFDKVLQLGGEENVLFKGKVLDVKEDIACLCVEHNIQRCKYKNYNPDSFKPEGIKVQGFNYGIFSFQSIFEPQYKYCVIYEGQKNIRIVDKKYIKNKAEYDALDYQRKIEHTSIKPKGIIGAGPGTGKTAFLSTNSLVIKESELNNIVNQRIIDNIGKNMDLTLSGFAQIETEKLQIKVNSMYFENKKSMYKPPRKEKKSNMFESRSGSKIRKMR